MCAYHTDQTIPIFTNWTEVLSQDLAKPRRHEIRVESFQLALEFDRQLDSSAAVMPV